MTAHSKPILIEVDDHQIAGKFLTPRSKIPGVLFVHGWGGSLDTDLKRAKGIAGLGCVCLTFDMRGHAGTREQKNTVTREDNLKDVVAAYDRLVQHPGIDPTAIVVIGSSYGAYLSAILTTLRSVRWLVMQVPALYKDEQWLTPKGQLDKHELAAYRRSFVKAADNRALTACSKFEGDVLIIESEHDKIVPHSTIMSYRAAFQNSHSLSHRIIDDADHSLTDESSQEAYTSILVNWVTEMVVGARLG